MEANEFAYEPLFTFYKLKWFCIYACLLAGVLSLGVSGGWAWKMFWHGEGQKQVARG